MSELSDYKRCVSDPLEAQLRATIAGLREHLRALASPVGGDGSLQAEDRPSVPTEGLSPLVVALCESLKDNDDPNEPIADNGASVLDGWRDLARRILAAPGKEDS